MKYLYNLTRRFLVLSKSLVARVQPRKNEENFQGIYFLEKGTINKFSALAEALVARNFQGIYFLEKGTIK